MLWLRLGANHPARRHVAPTAANEVRLVVVTACPTRVGVIFPMYGYALRQSTVFLQHQAHPIKSWFHFAQNYKESCINQQFDPCCT